MWPHNSVPLDTPVPLHWLLSALPGGWLGPLLHTDCTTVCPDLSGSLSSPERVYDTCLYPLAAGACHTVGGFVGWVGQGDE